MADQYKKIAGVNEDIGPGAQLKLTELSGGGHGLAMVLEEGDIEIGAVEIKDATSSNRVVVTATGDLQITLGGETVVLGAGTATFGKLAANSGVDIGDVDILSIAASETHVGEVGSPGISISQTPTVTAGAYLANDVVGGLLTFASAARVSGGGGVIKSMIILDDAGQDAQLELWLFYESFTNMSDNAPWAPSEADLRKLVAVITTSDGAWFAAGTPSAAVVEASQRYDLAGTSLFGQLVTRGTPAYVATDDISVIISVLQD